MPSGRVSAITTGTFEQIASTEAEPTENLRPGLYYSLHEGELSSAKNIAIPEKESGSISNFSFPKNHPSSWFAVQYTGFIRIPADGMYRFYTESDDGSVLYIGEQLVVNNDGFKYGEEKSGQIALRKGIHPISVGYFQGKYGSYLTVSYESDKIEKQELPSEILFY